MDIIEKFHYKKDHKNNDLAIGSKRIAVLFFCFMHYSMLV